VGEALDRWEREAVSEWGDDEVEVVGSCARVRCVLWWCVLADWLRVSVGERGRGRGRRE